MRVAQYGSEVSPGAVFSASVETRVGFLRRTYAHLAAAIAAFVVLEGLLVTSDTGAKMTATMLSGQYSWLIVLGLFMLVSWVADKWARSATSRMTQYVGLGLYVLAEVIIFCPLLFIVVYLADAPEIPAMAGLMTLLLFGGLTATVFITKKDFSFLRGALSVGFLAAMGVIVAGILFGFSLGLFFSLVMVVLAAGSILYTTSSIMRHYRSDQHVSAALALFAGIALMFWYIINILMSLRD